jgi:hypothetical protein
MSDQLKLDLVDAPVTRSRVPTSPLSPSERARADLREEFRARLDEGTTCQCCGRWAKRYRRHVNSTMAGCLCVMLAMTRERIAKGEDTWLRAEDVGQRLRQSLHFAMVSYPHGEIGKLAFNEWGLVEAKLVDPRGKKKASGLWRVTERGRAFVEGSLQIPRYLWVYDNHVDSASDEKIGLRQCFKTTFNYQDLL